MASPSSKGHSEAERSDKKRKYNPDGMSPDTIRREDLTDSKVKKLEHVKNSFIGAIDQGTTSSRFIVFDSKGKLVVSHQIEFVNSYPQAG